MNTSWSKLLPVLLCVALLAGCTSDTVPVNNINVSLLDLQLATPGPMLTVSYYNDNMLPIIISESSHKFYLNDVYIGIASTHEAVGLPITGTVTQKISLTLDSSVPPAKVRALLDHASPTYRFVSSMRLSNYDMKWTFKTTSQGRYDPQHAAMPSPK